eukprot:350699-Chlamydomonas_euryale.AAC.21
MLSLCAACLKARLLPVVHPSTANRRHSQQPPVACTLLTARSTLHPPHCTLHTAPSTHCTLHTAPSALYPPHCSPFPRTGLPSDPEHPPQCVDSLHT